MSKNESYKDLLSETVIRIGNKDIFVDLKKNKSGVYLSISERRPGSGRNTLIIPSSGISRLRTVLDEVLIVIDDPIMIRFKEDMYLYYFSSTAASKVGEDHVGADPQVSTRSVYVTALSWDTNEEDLKTYFSSIGNVVNATILRQQRRVSKSTRGKSSLGCGIVEFETKECAESAILTLNDTELDGRKIRVREDRVPLQKVLVAGKEGHSGNNGEGNGNDLFQQNQTELKENGKLQDRVVDPGKVFVTGLAWETTSEDLVSFFSEVGDVVDAIALVTKKGRAMGSGIVEFEDPSSVEHAIKIMSGRELKGRIIGVRICYK